MEYDVFINNCNASEHVCLLANKSSKMLNL